MPPSSRVAAAALGAALGVALTLPWWVPVDEAVFRWIQFHRTCSVDQAARWIDPIVRAVLAAIIAAAAIGGREKRRWSLLALLVVFVTGAASVELLKTAIERLRPSSTPAMISGNSFPSGHTNGTTLAATIAVLLVRARGWPRGRTLALGSLAALCVVAQGFARLLTGSHWLSDALASVFLGVGWVLSIEWFAALPRTVLAAGAIAATVVFAFFDTVPRARLHLPSAIDEDRPAVASVELGTPESLPALVGSWSKAPSEPIGPVAWAMSPTVGLVLRDDGNDGAGVLKMTLRPPSGSQNRRACVRVTVSVNGWTAPEIALTRGWREYHLEPPPGVLRRGPNQVELRILTEEHPTAQAAEKGEAGLVAFRYVKLYRAS